MCCISPALGINGDGIYPGTRPSVGGPAVPSLVGIHNGCGLQLLSVYPELPEEGDPADLERAGVLGVWMSGQQFRDGKGQFLGELELPFDPMLLAT